MYSVDLYNRVRRACHVEGKNHSEAARLFGIDRKTVAKILKHSVPPGYRRSAPPVRPKLDPFIATIDQILKDDKRVIKKQRHTAKRIHARLRPSRRYIVSTAGQWMNMALLGALPSSRIMCARRSGGRGKCLCRLLMRRVMLRWISARRLA